MKRGMAKGMAEGMERGMAKGRQEERDALVAELRSLGIDDDIINEAVAAREKQLEANE